MGRGRRGEANKVTGGEGKETGIGRVEGEAKEIDREGEGEGSNES